MREWKPFETAPKDGRMFIAGYRQPPQSGHMIEADWVGLARFNPNYPKGPPTIEYENAINRPRHGLMPTHWMELPDLPA